MLERIDKFISSQRNITRSEIKKLINIGAIKVNDTCINSGSLKIDTDKDIISLSGSVIEYKKKVYIIINKPMGYVSAVKDARDKTVIDLLPQELARKDLFPAGRLDKDTEGMVLITNDGDLSHRILAPKKHIPKYYVVKLAKPFKNDYIKIFNDGMKIDGGDICLPARVKGLTQYENIAFLELFEGKFHQVKRMFKAVENHVEFLIRVQMGGLAMPVKLPIGGHMELLHKDVENLLITPRFEDAFEESVPFFSSYLINKLE